MEIPSDEISIPDSNANWKNRIIECLNAVEGSLLTLREKIDCLPEVNAQLIPETKNNIAEGLNGLITIFKRQRQRLEKEEIPRFSKLADDLTEIRNQEHFRVKK
jgi:hypothetical protein